MPKNAIFKEVFSTINGSVYAGLNDASIQQNPSGYSTVGNYLAGVLDTVTTCIGNQYTGGCWDGTIQGQPCGVCRFSFKLHNGATIVCCGNYNGGNQHIAIDWNGTTGPNTIGDDIFWGWVAVSPGGGQITYRDATSQTMLQNIYSGN